MMLEVLVSAGTAKVLPQTLLISGAAFPADAVAAKHHQSCYVTYRISQWCNMSMLCATNQPMKPPGLPCSCSAIHSSSGHSDSN